MYRRIKIFCIGLILTQLVSCNDETQETVPTKPIEIDTIIKIDTSKIVEEKPKHEPNLYKISEDIILHNAIIKNTNDALVKNHLPKMISKIVDNPKDSVFSIKLGSKVDTTFVQKFDFYIHKKSKQISVYDVGEDRLIPLKEWNLLEEQ